ncbi:MAG: nucleotidyltransferase domain-containing protein [Deltaproteobacteria bacterium]|nr:nucleotidyltransferase domain-containing protein [Deltaproteobacteria bacterium]
MSESQILNQDPTLARIVGRLVEAFHPESLYLFGSRARGEADADSDYDIVMVVSDLPQPAYRIAQDAHSSLWDIGAATDIVVWSRSEFARRLHLRASFPATVVREGKLLHAA